MRSFFLRATLGLTALLVVTAAAFFSLSGRLESVAPEAIDLARHPPFRSWDEHHEIYARGDFPYIVELEGPTGAVLYIGALHATDQDHEQWEPIRAAWASFQPTVALNEGRSRYFRWASLSGGISDPKLAYVLAREDGIPIYSIEPGYQTEVNALLRHWPAELVASYFSLRVIASESGGDPERAEAVAPGLIRKRTEANGLRGTLTGAGDLDAVWQEHLPDGPDWRTLSNVDSVELLRRIGDDSREVRGQHMVRAIATLANNGERVVAVVGASHVIRHEPTLRSLLASQESQDPDPVDQTEP